MRKKMVKNFKLLQAKMKPEAQAGAVAEAQQDLRKIAQKKSAKSV